MPQQTSGFVAAADALETHGMRKRLPITITPRGFSLIEIMIAVAILGIVVAVALPSYQGSVRKSRRADAMAAVSAIQQSQERWRGNNPTYSTSLAQLGVTEPALYSLTVLQPPSPATLGTGYIVVAEGRAAQAADTQCKRMSVKLVDGNLSYGSCASCGNDAFTYATSNACWVR